MSETLSYQEPAPTELNEAEQEALEVGEQMEADQNQLRTLFWNIPIVTIGFAAHLFYDDSFNYV